MATETEPTRVYSYIRFSTEAQGKEGRDSERRQNEWRDRFMAAHPTYVLDDELKLLDDACSAYKDEHRGKDGKLGQFLDHVEHGRIPTGSILLVESIDRLTRLEPFTALEMICFGLLKHGITIQTQIARYDREAATNGQIHGLIAEITRAYQESKHKSERVRAAFDNKFKKARTCGKKVTARCPAWLWLDKETDEFVEVPGARETIQRIYQMKLDGLSQHKIEKTLNAKIGGATWQRPKGWGVGYIRKIWSNPAVIGELQRYRRGADGKRRPVEAPIPGYFPVIVDPDTFYAVQSQLAGNRGKGGRNGKKWNVFTHIIKCGYCSGAMYYKPPHARDAARLKCSNAKRGLGCVAGTVRYAEVVDVLLRGCVYLDPAQVLPAADEHAAKAAALRKQRDGELAELQGIKQRRKNFLDQLGRTNCPETRDDYQRMRATLAERANELEDTTAEVMRQLVKLENGTKNMRCWQRGVADLIDAIEDDEAADMRAKLSAHLRTFIDCIEVFPHGFPKVAEPATHCQIERGEPVPGKRGRRRRVPAKRWWDADVDTIIETLDAAYDDTLGPRPTNKRWAKFERYVLDRRMSKEGRFYRVHFKTGERVDLVPPGGLATGYTTVGKTVEKTLPNIAGLWKDFNEA
ncbi:recombinase family protein [Algisphaera agarilytica]|uniref:DNA invertase Pin-like site-specific DNA recombinase n=1 Tax=Algisphaera agarilytica TaxID=1385975 RepID=A0A7X0H9G9_9BACT|nr:recombinase family protein [Algisphaera agarilytica]MBB6431548.1 DNA invertase Pin-like site-specific DNA recombinase [Algisphaera agarilytica]